MSAFLADRDNALWCAVPVLLLLAWLIPSTIRLTIRNGKAAEAAEETNK